jgi:hypothetical protein
MEDLQKMLYLLSLNEPVDTIEQNLIDKMVYLLREIPGEVESEPSENVPNAVTVPVEVIEANNVQGESLIAEQEPEIFKYNKDCKDPTNQDIIADFITVDGKNITSRCITGENIKNAAAT